MNGYKVLTNSKHSIMRNSAMGGILYRVGHYVEPRPKHGPLCVFDTLPNARAYARFFDSHSIWKCSFTRSSEEMLYIPSVSQKTRLVKNEMPLFACPYGTILATAVRLNDLVEQVP